MSAEDNQPIPTNPNQPALEPEKSGVIKVPFINCEGFMLVSKEDKEKIRGYRFSKLNNGSACGWKNGEAGPSVCAHRMIYGLEKDAEIKKVVVHKNGNKADNTRENVLVMSYSEMMHYRQKKKQKEEQAAIPPENQEILTSSCSNQQQQ